MKKLFITILVLAVIGVGFYYGYQKSIASKSKQTTLKGPVLTLSNGSTITLPPGAKVAFSSAKMSMPENAVTKSLSLEAGLNSENEVVVQDNPEMKIIIKPTLVEAGPPAKYRFEIQRPAQPGMPMNFPMSIIQINEQKEATMMQSLNMNGKMLNLLIKIKPTLLEAPSDGNNGKVTLDLKVSTW